MASLSQTEPDFTHEPNIQPDAPQAGDWFIRATDTTNFMLDDLKFPHELRGLVDALIGASGGREYFDLSHLALAARLAIGGGEFARLKAVQRLLAKLERWQRRKGVLLFAIVRGGGIEKRKTAYRDHLTPVALAAADEALRDPYFRDDPRAALEPIARRMVGDLPSFEPETGDEPPSLPDDDGKQITHNMTRIENIFLERIAERVIKNGGDPFENIELLTNRLRFLVSNRCAKMSHQSTTEADTINGDKSGDVRSTVVAGNVKQGEPGQMCPRSPLVFALEHVAAGIPVFPVRRENKQPLTRHGFKDATTDAAMIERWARRFPTANFAMPTGEASGITVLDVDARHGGDESLKTLLDECGALPNTKVIKTGGGGLHFYFRRVAGLRNSESLLSTGLDIRADGGYVVIAGGFHASGATYDVLCDEPLAEMPAWMVEKLTAEKRQLDKYEVEDVTEPDARRADGSRPAAGIANGCAIPDGVQNSTLFRRVACSLRGHGAEYDEILAAVRTANDARCTGKKLEDAELRKLSKSATRYAPGRAAGMASRIIVRREPDAGHSPETGRESDETLTEFDASPPPDICPVGQNAAPKAEPHGFGGADFKWSFPMASGASSYAPKEG
jgi:hypothetical protein